MLDDTTRKTKQHRIYLFSFFQKKGKNSKRKITSYNVSDLDKSLNQRENSLFRESIVWFSVAGLRRHSIIPSKAKHQNAC